MAEKFSNMERIWIFKFMKLIGHTKTQPKTIFSKTQTIQIKDKERILKAARGKISYMREPT